MSYSVFFLTQFRIKLLFVFAKITKYEAPYELNHHIDISEPDIHIKFAMIAFYSMTLFDMNMKSQTGGVFYHHFLSNQGWEGEVVDMTGHKHKLPLPASLGRFC